MTWSHVCVIPTVTARLIVLFAILWPIGVAFSLRRRATSAGPIAAMLVVLGVVQCGVWLSFINVIEGLSLSGGGRAAGSAGIAEALAMFSTAALSMIAIAVIALVKRHRPIVDRLSAGIAAALMIQLAATLLFAARMAPVRTQTYVAAAWAAVALLTAIGAAVWLFRSTRARVEPRPLRGGVAAVAAAYAIAAVALWQQIQRYVEIAMFG